MKLALIILISASLNFSLFLVTYNKLATPYLHEEQRMDNADFIMIYVTAGFLLISLVSVLAAFGVTKKTQNMGHPKSDK